MVGIVVVAHSARLALEVEALARHMLREQVPVVSVGGVDDPEHPFGTDPTAIMNAVERVYSGDGVVVLMDMGSAVLSAETALELLPGEMRGKVRLCEAPIVEGAVSAAVRSEGGGTLEEVLEEARGALRPKAAQLGAPQEAAGPQGGEAPRGEKEAAEKEEAFPQSVRLTVRNRLGVHARPAARLVSAASRFDSEITVRNLSRDTAPVNARSINLVSTLGIRRGDLIEVAARGLDAGKALEAITALVESGFGERDGEAAREAGGDPGSAGRALAGGEAPVGGRGCERPVQPGAGMSPALPENELRGIPASPGIALGPARLYRPEAALPRAGTDEAPLEGSSAELWRLREAIEKTGRELRRTRGRVSSRAGYTAAELVDAQLLSLRDPALLETAERAIRRESKNAAAAWRSAVEEMTASYRSLDTPYLAARAADLEGLSIQVLLHLVGREGMVFRLDEPAVLIAGDLSPADLARVDLGKVMGICTAYGGATSHGAILARSAGIPAVVGLGPEILRIAEGAVLAVDGGAGTVLVDPPDPEKIRAGQRAWKASRDRELRKARSPAVTRDGVRVVIEANLGGAREAGYARLAGAEGVGVLRTEFLFLDRDQPPSEEEQLEAYRGIAGALEGFPLTVRLLDAGGDKQLTYLDLEPEANPYLGVRGVRLLLRTPDLLRTQLRAVLRAAAGHPVRLLIPMVSSVREVLLVKEMLAAERERLRDEGVPSAAQLAVGVMIEVPSAALGADRLAGAADFFSIGTNDLAQYVMAAERGNARVAGLCDALHPAVLRLVRDTVAAGTRAGVPVAVCGEVAGDPKAVAVLLGLGVRELSVNPVSIPEVKKTVTRVSVPDAERLAAAVVDMDSSDQVRSAAGEMLENIGE